MSKSILLYRSFDLVPKRPFICQSILWFILITHH